VGLITPTWRSVVSQNSSPLINFIADNFIGTTDLATFCHQINKLSTSKISFYKFIIESNNPLSSCVTFCFRFRSWDGDVMLKPPITGGMRSWLWNYREQKSGWIYKSVISSGTQVEISK
jgi:hypothetical protein